MIQISRLTLPSGPLPTAHKSRVADAICPPGLRTPSAPKTQLGAPQRVAPSLFSPNHSFSQFFLLSPLTPSCCRTSPLVLLGLQGDRAQLASIWCSPLARAPAPWAFRSLGRIIPLPLTFQLGPTLLGFHHVHGDSEAAAGSPALLWLCRPRPG